MFLSTFSLQKITKPNRGFTLIEMLVSLSLFTIVIVITVGTFLTIISSNRNVTADQATYDSLVFALDSMTREIRTGTFYNCRSGANDSIFNGISPTANQNCEGRVGSSNVHGLSVVESGGSITGVTDGRIAYYHDRRDGYETIMRKVGNGAAERIVSESVRITNAQFWVTGSQRMSDNHTETVQPSVTIVIEAESEEGKLIRLQTTIAQRLLDI